LSWWASCLFQNVRLKISVTFLVLTFYAGAREFDGDPRFQKFVKQLFHTCINTIKETLKPGMRTPELTLFPDGYHRRAVFCEGPYMADYPEQVLAAGIVSNWCPM
jgi:hypothetical protein